VIDSARPLFSLHLALPGIPPKPQTGTPTADSIADLALPA